MKEDHPKNTDAFTQILEVINAKGDIGELEEIVGGNEEDQGRITENNENPVE